MRTVLIGLTLRKSATPRFFPFQPSAHRTTPRTQLAVIARLCRRIQLLESVASWLILSAGVLTCFARQLYGRTCLRRQQPAHAKAGSRWPELQGVRYAVVSLLSWLTPGLIPALASGPAGSRSAYAPAYLLGSCTVSCFLPFFRRRLKTSRPHRVDILSRNPCVRIRRLLRGR